MPLQIPDWVTYFAIYEHAPAIVSVDRKWQQIGPLPGVDRFVLISLSYKEVHNSGFPTEPELRRLFAIEEKIMMHGSAVARIYFLGKITAAGHRHLYLYTTADHSLPLLLRRLFAAFAGREYTLQETTDPEWRQYFDVLLPDEEQSGKIHRAGDWDNPEEADPQVQVVDHWFYFDQLEDAQAFTNRIQQEGFVIVHFELLQDHKPFAYLLIAARAHPIVGQVLNRILARLEELATEHHGKYDGWDVD